MRQFYKVLQKWQRLSAKLSQSHYCEILWFDNNKFYYYIKIIEELNLSVRELREKIKSKEYERLPKETKNKLVSEDVTKIEDLIKNPIMIKNSSNYEIFSEKLLPKINP